MKRATPFLFIVAVLLAVLLVAIPAQGSGCRVVAVKQVVVKEQVAVVAAAVVTPVVAQFIPVPLYGATYNPYAYPVAPQAAPQYAPHAPQATPCADLAGTVKALSDELRSLKAQLGKPTAPHMPPAEGGSVDPFNPAPQAGQSDSVSRILSARCASCHDEGRAKSAGKGVVLTQGGKAKAFAPEELGAIIASVSTKTMPRGVQMPDGERIELIAALTGAK